MLIHNRPLDEVLNQVVNKGEHSDLPLGIRRFVEFRGCANVAEAMVNATNSILAEAGDNGFNDPPISVRALCELMKVNLIGDVPESHGGKNQILRVAIPRTGYTGLLRLDRNGFPSVLIPEDVDFATARISVAHEIGHLLIHTRDGSIDTATIRMPTNSIEESLAEYGARLLMLPRKMWEKDRFRQNMAEYCVLQSSVARVTIHSAVARLGDPDLPETHVRGAILWRITQPHHQSHTVYDRLTPFWHLCPGAFVPLKRSKARRGSLVAQLAEELGAAIGSRIEDVHIGTFCGVFRVDAFAWGSVAEGTRLVLSVFSSSEFPAEPRSRNMLESLQVPLPLLEQSC